MWSWEEIVLDVKSCFCSIFSLKATGNLSTSCSVTWVVASGINMRADAEAFPLFLITLCICSLLKSLPIISSWPKENLIRGWGWNVFTRWSYAMDSLGASPEDFTWKCFLTPVLWNGFVYANLMSQGIKFNVWTGCGAITFPKGDWCFPCWVPYISCRNTTSF